MDLMFKDVDVHINKTQILNKVTGLVKPKQMLALMGPSGAGKSTLLNALSGRIRLTQGQVTLNKEPLTKLHTRRIAYVMQQDLFFPYLTLRETLTFHAILRLPDKMPHELKIQRVQDIIDTMDLQKCSETVMGSGNIPGGLSGGERKRASIGIELIYNPLVVLIDEATSGLDYAVALNLMKTLKRYTEENNKTMVVTIHQPSSQMFHLFSELLLLVDGQVAYFGNNLKVIDVFADLGHPCAPHYNPADFIMEKLKDEAGLKESVIKRAQEDRKTSWPTDLSTPYVKQSGREHRITFMNRVHSVDLTSSQNGKYRKKHSDDSGISSISISKIPQDNSTESRHSSVIGETDLHLKLYMDDDTKWPTGFWTQFKALMMRTWKQSAHRIFTKISITQAVAVTLFTVLMWFRTPRTEETLSDRLGLIFCTAIYWPYICMGDAMQAFPVERPVVNRERAEGCYRLSAYYLAKVTSELPLVCALPVVYVCIVYWCTGLHADAVAFITHLFTLLYCCMGLQAFGIMLGVTIKDNSKRYTTGIVFLLIGFLSGGYYQRNFHDYNVWMRYTSIFYFTFNAMLHAEFKGADSIQCLPANQTFFASCIEGNATMVTGEEVLVALEETHPNWINYVVLTAWLFMVHLVGYFWQRFFQKPHKL